MLFEGLVVDFDECFEEILLNEVVLPADEDPPALSSDEEP